MRRPYQALLVYCGVLLPSYTSVQHCCSDVDDVPSLRTTTKEYDSLTYLLYAWHDQAAFSQVHVPPWRAPSRCWFRDCGQGHLLQNVTTCMRCNVENINRAQLEMLLPVVACGRYIYFQKTPFEDLPPDYQCPQCSAFKKRFAPYDPSTGKVGAFLSLH